MHRLSTDQEIIALRKDVSIVFQQYNPFPHKTALENIMMAPVDVLGQPQAEVEVRARGLAMRPSLMLFDEVTAALFGMPQKERTRPFLEQVL